MKKNMKIEEVQSTTKKQRIATHTHIKGLGLELPSIKVEAGAADMYSDMGKGSDHPMEAPCIVDLVILVEVILVAMEIKAAGLVEKALHLLEQVDTVELVLEDQGVAMVELARAAQESLVVLEAQNVWVVSVALVWGVQVDLEIHSLTAITVQAVVMTSEMSRIVVIRVQGGTPFQGGVPPGTSPFIDEGAAELRL